MKFSIKIIILTSLLISSNKLPNDVRWVRESEEYAKICESIFSRAYQEIEKRLNANSLEIMDYDTILASLKNNNERNISKVICSKNECIGCYSDEQKPSFKVEIPSLSNYLIQKIKKNKIDYKFTADKTAFIRSGNYAIIVDLDETILDNSQYQVMLYDKNEKYNPSSWSEWVNKEEAELVPGAKEFLDKVRSLGVNVIFISNRMDKNLNPTVKNLKKLKAFSKDDIFLLRLDKSDTKVIRRGEVYSQAGRMQEYPFFTVISYLGDAFGDFPKDDSECVWGENCHVFPNPMYGKW